MEPEVDTHILRVGRDGRRALEHCDSLGVVTKGRVSGCQAKHRVEVERIRREDSLEQGNDTGVLLVDEEPRGLFHHVEQADHLYRARRVLPDDGRGSRIHVAEARQ